MQLPGQRKPKVSLADQKGCSAKEVGVQEKAHGGGEICARGSDMLWTDKLTLYHKARHSQENLGSSAEESVPHSLNSGVLLSSQA